MIIKGQTRHFTWHFNKNSFYPDIYLKLYLAVLNELGNVVAMPKKKKVKQKQNPGLQDQKT